MFIVIKLSFSDILTARSNTAEIMIFFWRGTASGKDKTLYFYEF